MGFFSNIFGAGGDVAFWRSRVEKLEKELELKDKKLEDERSGNREFVKYLIDELLKLAGAKPVSDRADRKADVNGFEAEFHTAQKKKLKESEREALEIEKKAFVEDCVKNGMDAAHAKRIFDEEKDDILKSEI